MRLSVRVFVATRPNRFALYHLSPLIWLACFVVCMVVDYSLISPEKTKKTILM